MSSVFTNWTDKLGDLDKKTTEGLQNKSTFADVKTALGEIRELKKEIQKLKDDMITNASEGHIIRDEKRLVLSAPEIVIGNVGKDGILKDGGSTIIIRGNDVNLEGVDGGAVITRATNILQIVEEPGIDGQEHSVPDGGSIVNLAPAISLHASDNKGTYYETPDCSSGLHLHSDTALDVSASTSKNKRSGKANDVLASLNALMTSQTTDVTNLKQSLKESVDALDKVYKEAEKLTGGDISSLRANAGDLSSLHDRYTTCSKALASVSEEYMVAMGALIDTQLSIANIKKSKKDVDDVSADDFKKNSTKGSVTVTSEKITLESMDGDKNIRTNAGAGINMNALTYNLTSNDATGKLLPDSAFKIKSQDVELDTSTEEKTDGNGKRTTAGRVNVNTKEFNIVANDSEIKDNAVTSTTPTVGSSVNFRTERFTTESTNEKGEATGYICLNANQIEIKTMNMTPGAEQPTEKELAKDSSLTIISNKMVLGTRGKDKAQAESITMSGNSMEIFGKDKVFVQQGDNDSALTLEKGGFHAKGTKETQLYGTMTFNGATKFLGKSAMGDVETNNIKVKNQIKNNYLESGPSVPDSTQPGTAPAGAELKDNVAINQQTPDSLTQGQANK